MNIWGRYSAYINDNPEGYWFKRRWHGWGWTPVRWQGWLVVGVAVALIIWNSKVFSTAAQSGIVTGAMLAWFFARLAAIVTALLAVAYLKGEAPRWTWGTSDAPLDGQSRRD